MMHQGIDITVDFDVEYEVTRRRQPAREDEPPSAPEFEVKSCAIIMFGKTYALVYDDLPESVRESIEEAIVDEIDAGD